MTYGDVLRIAASSTHTTTCQDESRLIRTLPPIPTQSAKTTGNVIDGQFEMIRTKDGKTIFVGENGQWISR